MELKAVVNSWKDGDPLKHVVVVFCSDNPLVNLI